MPGPFTYSLFGLQVRSDIELPELPGLDCPDDPDVRISIGAAPPANGDDTHFAIEEIGSYWIGEGGTRIIVEPCDGAPARNVRLFLLGSAFGALLHQRGILPLHANAVEIEGRAFAFMGPSGAGKSTLAAAFHDRGFKVIADDVCAVRFGRNGEPLACPGVPRLRLWEEALAASGRADADYERSLSGGGDIRKYDVPVLDRASEPNMAPLGAVFLLAEGEGPAAERMAPLDAIEAIYANTYRGQYARAVDHWEASVALVRACPVFRFSRQLSFDAIGDQCDFLVKLVSNREFHTQR